MWAPRTPHHPCPAPKYERPVPLIYLHANAMCMLMLVYVHTWPVSDALIRKYVDSSMGHFTPLGTYTNEPSLNTALFSAAK